MESYITDWITLIFRWLHLITGIAWIGASFYFIWLDNSLREPPQWKQDKGIKGDLWAIHGGGIYEVAKYQLAPEKMPDILHWFKWEAYTTWLTGMVLLVVIFYFGADSYLIAPEVAELSQWQAVSIGVGFLVAGWLIYDLLCNTPLAKSGYLIGALLILISVVFAYALCHLFSGRGAFIHMGAIIGTIMVGNVFRVIIPSQQALVRAIEDGHAPDMAWGQKAKLRSTHNNYLTLPVLFIMISNHYPMTYASEHNWLILLAIIAITAFARHYFNLEHRGINRPWILAAAAAATLVIATLIAPRQSGLVSDAATTDAPPSLAEVSAVLFERCTSCHSANPTDDIFRVAQGGVNFDSIAQMRQWAPRIQARAVDTNDMPFMNKTGMTDEERVLIGRWIGAGAPAQ